MQPVHHLACSASRRTRPIPDAAIGMKNQPVCLYRLILPVLAKSDNVGVINRTGMIIAGEYERRGGVAFQSHNRGSNSSKKRITK